MIGKKFLLCWTVLGFLVGAGCDPLTSTNWPGERALSFADDPGGPEVPAPLIVEFLDSAEYRDQVSWDEHVVLTFRRVLLRPPTPLEFLSLRLLSTDIGLPRSAVLGIALQQAQKNGSAEVDERLMWMSLAWLPRSLFALDEAVSAEAKWLASLPLEEIFEALTGLPGKAEIPAPDPVAALGLTPGEEAGKTYPIFFGFMHAHSELSDGKGGPEQAYAYARDQGQLDFFALTDHGELLSVWPWQHKWQKLRQAAESYDDPGRFVALWGFEWSNPVLGHVNVIHTEDYISCLSHFTLGQLYEWLQGKNRFLGMFNHPGMFNLLHIELAQLGLFAPDVLPMVGIEVLNTDQGLDTFYYGGSWKTDKSYLDAGNLQGWALAPVGTQDNHQVDFGTRNPFRTAVLADGLTRDQLMDAFQQRRVYATEDSDLYLDLRANGFPMGSRIEASELDFEVLACDASLDGFSEIRLYRGGELLERAAKLQSATPPSSWKVPAQGCVRASFHEAVRSPSTYYYVIVTEKDDHDGNGRNDEAISAPIWVAAPR